jgi:LmbE family N-acetylglucosaminyl deacetylase
MFFGPMLLSRHAGQQISLLCLSTGNADGQGETRVKELAAAAKWVGIR